jgi:hypothetical protein
MLKILAAHDVHLADGRVIQAHQVAATIDTELTLEQLVGGLGCATLILQPPAPAAPPAPAPEAQTKPAPAAKPKA